MKIIIGASGGIGGKLWWHYEEYEDVIGTYYTNDPVDLNIIPLDITHTDEINAFAESVDLDDELCLINCSGMNYNSMAHKANIDKWVTTLIVNLVGPFDVIRAFLPHMRKHNYGRIINMSSVVAQMGVMGTSAYAASKAGLWGMTKAIAAENKDKGITINNLNLGYMDAGMALKLPVDKRGSIDNIINAIDFLVDSDFVTGTSIDINGGLL